MSDDGKIIFQFSLGRSLGCGVGSFVIWGRKEGPVRSATSFIGLSVKTASLSLPLSLSPSFFVSDSLRWQRAWRTFLLRKVSLRPSAPRPSFASHPIATNARHSGPSRLGRNHVGQWRGKDFETMEYTSINLGNTYYMLCKSEDLWRFIIKLQHNA